MARCPVCRAALDRPVCRRCGSDFTLARRAEEAGEGLLARALRALRSGCSHEAADWARRARELGGGELAARIEALALSGWRHFRPRDGMLQSWWDTLREAAAAVRRELGGGLRREVYRAALTLELDGRRLPFETNVAVKAAYQGGEFLTPYRIDWLLGERMAVLLGDANRPETVRGDLAAVVRLARLDAGVWLVFPAADAPRLGWVLNSGKTQEV